MPERSPSTESALLTAPPSTSERSPSPSSTARIASRGEKAEEYRKWDERGREWLYGYVWFEQRQDKGIARGYMQVSTTSNKLTLGALCSFS